MRAWILASWVSPQTPSRYRIEATPVGMKFAGTADRISLFLSTWCWSVICRGRDVKSLERASQFTRIVRSSSGMVLSRAGSRTLPSRDSHRRLGIQSVPQLSISVEQKSKLWSSLLHRTHQSTLVSLRADWSPAIGQLMINRATAAVSADDHFVEVITTTNATTNTIAVVVSVTAAAESDKAKCSSAIVEILSSQQKMLNNRERLVVFLVRYQSPEVIMPEDIQCGKLLRGMQGRARGEPSEQPNDPDDTSAAEGSEEDEPADSGSEEDGRTEATTPENEVEELEEAMAKLSRNATLKDGDASRLSKVCEFFQCQPTDLNPKGKGKLIPGTKLHIRGYQLDAVWAFLTKTYADGYNGHIVTLGMGAGKTLVAYDVIMSK
ncbi:hypothetical protein B0T22DRAFT_441289 [Podospora appendiculata]|uniref:Uncharacterized protein n=1 Tax=Podospora appendiculata TaxID=314037 RepID=A0AAE1CDV9_9PEZI|nr:hypothetical protein B0T22DRAFT_441289 [Podospora appendiculata]